MPDTSFTPIPEFQADSFSPGELLEILRVIQKYDTRQIKFSPSRRISLSGPNGEQLAEISRELRSMHKPALHGWITSLHSCPGEDCKYAIRSTREICDRIERIHLPRPLPAKMKIGLAGCLRCCTSPYVRDLGLIAEPKGWKLIFGGNAGGRPRIGDCVAKGLNDDQTIELIHRCIMVYLDKAAPKMRTARFMELYDAEKFKKNVLDTPLCNQPVEG